MRWSFVCLIAMGLALAAPLQAQDEEDTILVIARKMRLVDVEYALKDRALASCAIRTSSGDLRIDRIVCAILRDCVKSGVTEAKAVKLCMNARIESFASEGEEGGESLASLSELPEPPVNSRSLFDEEAATEPDLSPGIVVTTERNPMALGKWEFEQSGYYYSASRADLYRGTLWEECIHEEALKEALEAMLYKSFSLDMMPGHCYKWEVSLKDDRISGDQRCWIRKSMRLSAKLKGTIAPTSMRATREMRLYNPVAPRGADDTLHVTYQIVGKRVGECPA